MRKTTRIALALGLAVSGVCVNHFAKASTPVVVKNEAGFEGLENPSILYYPGTNTFVTGDTFQNHIDEGGGMFRDILRNEYPSPLAPYAPGAGWWDGDGANSANTDRQRVEAKGIVGLGHQQVEQTFEYSFDFRTDPTFTATSSFCHIFQLKATNGDDSPPLATISLYKSGSGIQGRVDCFSDGTSGTPQTETVPDTFSYTAGQWIHFVIRITPCAQGESTGGVQLSVNGGPFIGITNAAIDLQGSTDFRPKFGLYRGISTTNGVPVGDSWVEHRTVTGYIGTSNVLTWQGGQNNNTWDTATTANFLNGSSASVFNTIDQINFTNSSGNTTINIAGSVWPDFAYINSSANYTFQGTGSITGGSLRKDGTGTLTLATTNSYPGVTDITNGTLYVTGSIGNNSLADVVGGTLKLGSATALGSSNTNGLQIAGGTLDLNSFAIGSIAVQVQGTGVGGAGAIVNTGSSQTTALSSVTFTGDTTFGGSGRWDIRGTNPTLSTGGSSFNLTKTGVNQISLVGVTVDPALANININQGILAFQTSTTSMGDPAKSVIIASSGILDFYNTTAVMNKFATLNGGTIWAESGSGTQNTFAGAVTLSATGGIFDTGGNLTGGATHPTAVLTLTGSIAGPGRLTKNGLGTLTLSGTSSAYSGGTTVNAGTLVATNYTSLGIGNLTIHASALTQLQPSFTAPMKLTAVTLDGSTGNWTGSLDITSNKLIIEATASHATAVASAKDAVLFAKNNANSSGIFASGIPTGQQLVVVDNAVANFSSFGGSSNIDTNSILLASTVPGDTNLSGTVDITDLTVVANHWQQPATDWSQGDFDGNGIVDIQDLTAVANNWQYGVNGGNGSSLLFPDLLSQSSPTPEPASLALLALGGVFLLQRKRQ